MLQDITTSAQTVLPIAEAAQVTVTKAETGYTVTVCWHNVFNGSHMGDTVATAVDPATVGDTTKRLLLPSVRTS